MDNRTQGMLYMGLGMLLFFLSAGTWIIQLGVALLGLYLINYGLSLRGGPPLLFYIMRWFDGTRYR